MFQFARCPRKGPYAIVLDPGHNLRKTFSPRPESWKPCKQRERNSSQQEPSWVAPAWVSRHNSHVDKRWNLHHKSEQDLGRSCCRELEPLLPWRTPADVRVISSGNTGQGALLKFTVATTAVPIGGSFIPGPFINSIQAAFQEPRLLVVTGSRVEQQPFLEASYVHRFSCAVWNMATPRSRRAPPAGVMGA